MSNNFATLSVNAFRVNISLIYCPMCIGMLKYQTSEYTPHGPVINTVDCKECNGIGLVLRVNNLTHVDNDVDEPEFRVFNPINYDRMYFSRFWKWIEGTGAVHDIGNLFSHHKSRHTYTPDEVAEVETKTYGPDTRPDVKTVSQRMEEQHNERINEWRDDEADSYCHGSVIHYSTR